MRLLAFTPLLLSTVTSIWGAPIPVSIGGDGSPSLHRRTGDKIYRGGVQPIMPKQGEMKQDEHGNYVHGGSGISVTTDPSMIPHTQMREMSMEEAKAKFHITHDGKENSRDPNHHAVDIWPDQKFTPEGLKDHLNDGWKLTPATERLKHVPESNTELRAKVEKQIAAEAKAHSGSHQASDSSHNQASHTATASHQQHPPSAPATSGTGHRSFLEAVTGGKPAAQQHGSASHAGSGSQGQSHAASQGHTTPHQAPAAHQETSHASPAPAPAHGGSHQPSGSSHKESTHIPGASHQQHPASAPATSSTGHRSYLEALTGGKPAAQQQQQQQNHAPQQGSTGHGSSQAHASTHQAPAAHHASPAPPPHQPAANKHTATHGKKN